MMGNPNKIVRCTGYPFCERVRVMARETWERERCPECGILLPLNPDIIHSPEFCAQWRAFPLMERIPQVTLYGLTTMRKRMIDQQRRNMDIMRAIANAPRSMGGVRVDMLNPIRAEKVKR